MKNNETSLTSEIISTFDDASHYLSDCYYADEESELWFCRWKSREYETAARMVESVMNDDVFISEDGRNLVHESLAWYRNFLEQRGYDFKCLKLASLIERVNKVDITAA